MRYSSLMLSRLLPSRCAKPTPSRPLLPAQLFRLPFVARSPAKAVGCVRVRRLLQLASNPRCRPASRGLLVQLSLRLPCRRRKPSPSTPAVLRRRCATPPIPPAAPEAGLRVLRHMPLLLGSFRPSARAFPIRLRHSTRTHMANLSNRRLARADTTSCLRYSVDAPTKPRLISPPSVLPRLRSRAFRHSLSAPCRPS